MGGSTNKNSKDKEKPVPVKKTSEVQSHSEKPKVAISHAKAEAKSIAKPVEGKPKSTEKPASSAKTKNKVEPAPVLVVAKASSVKEISQNKAKNAAEKPQSKVEEKKSHAKAEEKVPSPKAEEKKAHSKAEEKAHTPEAEEKKAHPKVEEKVPSPKAEEKKMHTKAEEKAHTPKAEEKKAHPKVEENAPILKVEEKKSSKAEGKPKSASKSKVEKAIEKELEIKKPTRLFFLEVKPGAERVIKRGDKTLASPAHLDIQARRKGTTADETPEELVERIERELEHQFFIRRNALRPQICTKCGFNVVADRFTIDRELGYCADCAVILRLGETKEARRMEFNTAVAKTESEKLSAPKLSDEDDDEDDVDVEDILPDAD